MEFKKLIEIGHNLGLTSMLCGRLGKFILLYGGSNFPVATPPDGTRKVYNDIYLYDENFSLVLKKEGKIFPDRGITINLEDKIYYISGAGNTKIYEYYLENGDIVEREVLDIGQEIIGGFGGYYNNKIYFGKEYVYELDLDTLKLEKKAKFIGNVREQSVSFVTKGNIYVLSGASDICYLDSYRYNILKDTWEQLKETPKCLSGAASCKLDETRVLIVGGCNKEVYDVAVASLGSIDFKRKYFSTPREEFRWNQDIYIFNTEDQTYESLGGSLENATCGSSLIKVDNKVYLINGEVKPGYRTPLVLEGDIL